MSWEGWIMLAGVVALACILGWLGIKHGSGGNT